MKIVPKLTLVLVVGMCVVLAINGYLRVRRETAAFASTRSGRHLRAATTMRAAMANAWRMQDESAAVSTMEAIATGYTSLHASWVPGAAGPANVETTVDRSRTPEVWSTRVPIVVDGVPRGHVELSEEATADEVHARGVLYETMKTAFALTALSALIAFVVGHWVVGKPVRLLADKARRIGRGEFDDPLVLRTSDELAELALEMNAMCQRLTITLAQLRHADRLVTVGKLASGVAHELGTPLNVVTARAEMILQSSNAPDEIREFAAAIGTAAERMTEIIAQLLQFARRTAVTRVLTDVGALVRGVVDLLHPLARKRSVDVDVDVDEQAEPFDALVDRGQVQQVVTNLAMNAIQASPPGTRIQLNVDRLTASPPADVGSNVRDVVRIRVTDQGKGISASDLPRIFEPFFTTKPVGEGTGLGLAVAHGIVREHHGWIEVRSELGVGSTFEVFLPVTEAEG